LEAFLVARTTENHLKFADGGEKVSWLHIYIGYWTLTLNTQLAFIILDGLSIVIRIIDANDGGSADMQCQDRHDFVSVVHPK